MIHPSSFEGDYLWHLNHSQIPDDELDDAIAYFSAIASSESGDSEGCPSHSVIASSSSSEAPSSNTGHDTQERILVIQNYYLQGVGWAPNIDYLFKGFRDLCVFAGDDFAVTGKPKFSGMQWADHARSVKGAICAWRYEPDDLALKCWFSLPGSFMSSLSLSQQKALCHLLHDRFQFKCNRSDTAADDYRRRISPEEIDSFLRERPTALCHGKTHEARHKYCRKHCRRFYTVYLGSTQSDTFHRVYDAQVVHDLPAIRWEMQNRGKYAQTMFELFLNTSEDRLHGELAKMVFGCVDFRWEGDRTGDLGRRERLDWYQTLVDDAGGVARPSVPREPVTWERQLHWLEHQVSPTLAVFQKSMGDLFPSLMEHLLEMGRSMLRPIHYAMIRVYSAELSLGMSYE